ncbi:MAG: creatininase family protein [Gammaproteobacteria bacterium]|nr:creatininase family protein [Gammaproteobacteria bacterium]
MQPPLSAVSRLCLLLLCGVLAAAGPALAQGRDSVFLQNLTWTELRQDIRAGKTTILIPIGGTEQNGPDMALGKHNLRARLLSERIALRLGNALVAPVLAYVPEGHIHPPTGHMGFPGTITIPVGAFEQTLEYAARSFKHAGFQDIVFLGDHGGYQQYETIVADRLNRRWARTTVRAHALRTYYRVTQTEYVRTLRRLGYSDRQIGTHAGLADTSLTLALDPRLVRLRALRSGPEPGPAEGVYGDPRRSSAALGQLGVAEIVSRTVAAIRRDTVRRARPGTGRPINSRLTEEH